MSKPLPANSLPVINIAQPCPKDWDEMNGDQQKRFCDHCTKNVFNFAEMPRVEVNELVSSGQSVCARIYRKTDGSVVTLEDQHCGKRHRMFHKWFQRAALFAVALLSLVTFGGCDEETVRKAIPWLPEHEEEITGIVAPGAELGDIAMPVEEEPILGKIVAPQPKDALPELQPAETTTP